jgi:hypothetical protein
VRLAVEPERPATFPLELRIPGWAAGARVSVNGKATAGVRAGAFYRVEREWRAGDAVELVFPMPPRVSRAWQNAVVVERGPLVFSLRIGEHWRKLRDRPRAPDWEVYPTSPWNYALAPGGFEVREKPLGDYPYSPEGAPVEILAKGRRIPEWQMVNDSAGPVPVGPITSKQPEEDLILVPYGSAKLRVTAFPELAR